MAAVLLVWGLPDVPWWWEYPGHAGPTPVIIGSLSLTLLMSVPFLWRRRFPLQVLALAIAVLAIRAGLHRNYFSALAAVLVASYGIGAYLGPARPFARALGWLAAVAAVVDVTFNHLRVTALPFALLAAALLTGDAASARRKELLLAAKAADQAERSRIARDLHDLVAHQLTAIAMQAGAARLAFQSEPSQSEPGQSGPGQSGPGQRQLGQLGTPAELMGGVERLAREALIELNQLLGALRREPSDDPARPPAPTLADLPALTATARTAGSPVRLCVEGTPRPLPPGLELAGYRIVAEALANAARHAPEAPASVSVSFQPGRLEISVANLPSPVTGPGPASAARTGTSATGGRGLLGMRERAELYGGELEAGPVADGGYLVRAVLPDCAGTT